MLVIQRPSSAHIRGFVTVSWYNKQLHDAQYCNLAGWQCIELRNLNYLIIALYIVLYIVWMMMITHRNIQCIVFITEL